jgi:osmotically-inducible protein OsmY
MNSNSTHKIVVGIGLAAVFGVGVSVFAVRAKHEIEVARNAPAAALTVPADQNADTSAAAAAVQTPTDSTANPSLLASSPVATTSPAPVAPAPVARIAPVAGNGLKDAGDKAATERSKPSNANAAARVDRHIARARSGETPGSRIVSVASSRSARSNDSAGTDDRQLAAPTAGDIPSASAGASAGVQQPALQSGSDAATNAGATGGDAGPADSQITADVKSEIATAAPSSTVEVTTSNGTVAPAGSVPSQDAVDQAKQAAQRVAGVKRVDASALTVSNQ